MSRADDRLIAARAAIADACLGALPGATLGDVVLRDDQRLIVARAQRALAQQGGCLIAEEVGRGKTFIALALARSARAPLAVVPASLRTTWRAAAERAGVAIALASHEGLSRGRMPSTAYDFLIVDESHHFRTMTTRRHAALAELAALAPIVMLSATPLQNRARDLAAQVSLFLGERALLLDADRLARFVIRGAGSLDAMPSVRAPERIASDADDGDVLRAILALPPPARPLDGGDAGALRTIGLVRAWASSRAALVSTLRSRDRLATAIGQGVESGRAPTRREARAWHAAEGVVQLGFSSLLVAATPAAADLAALGRALAEDRRATDALLRVLKETPNPDAVRVEALRAVRARHPDRRVIAFSEFASTVLAFYAAMRGDAGVGMLTAREARIATGRISRDELLARFAPFAQRASPREAHQSVTLLLATDLLSEGVNLQDANVVVHLDLPWNPARLAQRVGRVRRIGGASEVFAYVLAPPASADALLDADARLRRKLASAERIVGAQFPVLPSLVRDVGLRADARSASAEGELVARLAEWRQQHSVVPTGARSATEGPACRGLNQESRSLAALGTTRRSWLAALSDGRLLAALGGRPTDEIATVLRATELATCHTRDAGEDEMANAHLAIDVWLSAESLASSCGLDDVPGPMRRTIDRWLASLAATLPRHQRALALPLMARLRECLRHPLPLGAERQLLTEATPAGNLERAVRIAEAARSFRPAPLQQPPTVVALILLPSGES